MYSINLTIHNKEFLLERVLESIKTNTYGRYELVMVLDGCQDKSEYIVTEFIKSNPKIKTKIIYADNIFETKSNNLAAKNSDGDFIIIVQDDMVINEKDWNKRLVDPINKFDDIFAVTSRTAHNWELNPNSRQRNTNHFVPNEWSDILIHTDHADRNNTPRNVLAIRESVNRGPLALDHKIVEQLGYFDEEFSPQDMDDHDLCYRASYIGKKCGCYWIDYTSLPEWGGTRVLGGPPEWLLRSNQKNVRIVYERHKKIIESPKNNEFRIV
jgi:glycosyltransferase involved in cell wall biosynthesis